MARTAVLAALLVLAAASARAEEADLIVNARVGQFPTVTVTVNVRDHATGARVGGLGKEAFQVREDMVPAELVSLEERHFESAPQVDVVFVFDTTGSMAEEIEGLVRKSKEFADILAQTGYDYRLALVSFSDVVEKTFPYTADVDAFKKQLSRLSANGGGDEPENQLDALVEAANRLPHRPGAQKIFLLVTDASFHSHDKVTSRTAQGVVETLKGKGIWLHVVGPDLEPYHWMPARLGGSFFDKDSGDFKQLVHSLAGGVAVTYVLTYQSPRPEDDATRRAVEVRVKTDRYTGVDATQYQSPSWVSASSRADFFQGEESAYAPRHVVDGDPLTVWAEGVPGDGAGEWLRFRFGKAVPVSRVALQAAAAGGFARPKEVRVVFDDASTRTFTLANDATLQAFAVAPAVTSGSMDLEIVSTYGGAEMTALAEVELSTGTPPVLLDRMAGSRASKVSLDTAESLNQKGVEAYHKGRLAESIALYVQALEKDPTHAQCWSNLGLAYRKVDDFPNAITANRKSISLARGGTRQGVMASSYYNIARIFEARGDWAQALQNYWWAQQNKPGKVYTDAISRMNAKLGRTE